MKSKDVVRALAALAQESRLAVYRLMVARGPQGLSAGAIGEKLGIQPATLSFHLKELANAGLLTAVPQGRFIIYSANFQGMNELLAFLTDNCCGGNPCIPVTACKPLRAKKKQRIEAET
jgi:ArsR family transcriptional regulator